MARLSEAPRPRARWASPHRRDCRQQLLHRPSPCRSSRHRRQHQRLRSPAPGSPRRRCPSRHPASRRCPSPRPRSTLRRRSVTRPSYPRSTPGTARTPSLRRRSQTTPRRKTATRSPGPIRASCPGWSERPPRPFRSGGSRACRRRGAGRAARRRGAPGRWLPAVLPAQAVSPGSRPFGKDGSPKSSMGAPPSLRRPMALMKLFNSLLLVTLPLDDEDTVPLALMYWPVLK